MARGLYALMALLAALLHQGRAGGERPAPYDPLTAQYLNWREEQALHQQDRMW